MSKTVIVIEVSNASEEQIQRDLGQAFHDFCNKNKGAGITASVLTEKTGNEILSIINSKETDYR